MSLPKQVSTNNGTRWCYFQRYYELVKHIRQRPKCVQSRQGIWTKRLVLLLFQGQQTVDQDDARHGEESAPQHA